MREAVALDISSVNRALTANDFNITKVTAVAADGYAEVVVSVSLITGDNPKLLLNFMADGQRVEQLVGLEGTAQNFGGFRAWYLCPGCGHRASKLFLPLGSTRWLCRECHQLTYRPRRRDLNHISSRKRVSPRLRAAQDDPNIRDSLLGQIEHHERRLDLLRRNLALLDNNTEDFDYGSWIIEEAKLPE